MSTAQANPSLARFYVEWEGKAYRIGDRVVVEVPSEGFRLEGRISGIVHPRGSGIYNQADKGIAFIMKRYRFELREGLRITRTTR